MAVITPQTNIRIMKLPIELDSKNQLTFTSESNQEYYFTHIEDYLELENATYMRADGTLRFNCDYDTAIQYNYCMYKNSAYSDKWFYAYITDVQWLSNSSVAIKLKTDVFQSWQFDIEYKQSFIEREHVNDDTVGKYTFPEGLETGEYISTKLQPTSKSIEDMVFCIGVTELLISVSYGTTNQRIPSGIKYIGCTSEKGVENICEIYDKAGKGDAINSVFVIPKDFFSGWATRSITISGTTYNIAGQVSTDVIFEYTEEIEVTKVNYLGNDYIPRNKKLLCYPYSYLQVSNHNGSVVNYNWEDFNLLDIGDNSIKFYLRGTITPGGSFSAYPINYKNILNNFDESIQYAKFPIGGWNNDVYTNWLTQNGINMSFQNTGGILGIVAGAGLMATGVGTTVGAGMVAGGIGTILNTLNTKKQHAMIPDQALGNTNVGDYSYQFGLTNLEFKRMSIKNEYAQIIDKFMDLYGYKVNITKVPNITGRRNWNFVKTIGCNIHLYAPQSDVDELKSMFDDGLTLWHHPTTYLDYSQNNDII